MTVEECLQQLRSIKDVSLATVNEHGLPQNRIIDVMIVEDNRLYFCIARGKDVYNHLIHHPYVAIVAMTPTYQMIRLQGKAKKETNQKVWIDRIFQENESMNYVYPGKSRYILDVFYIEEGELEYFDLSTEPIYRQSFALNQSKVNEKGFYITNACIGCGKCLTVCPQSCIHSGNPFTIVQMHCLHCGLCAEKCPKQAIERRGNKE